MSEAGLPGPGKKIDTARKLGGAVSDVAGAGWDWSMNQMKKMDPRQLWNKDIKTTFSSADKKPGGVIHQNRADIADNAKLEPRIAQQQATIDKMDRQSDRLSNLRNKQVLKGKPTDKTDASIARRQEVGNTATTTKDELTGKLKDVTPPDPTSRSVGAFALPVGSAEAGYRWATGSEEKPAGDSLVGTITDLAGQGIRKIAGAPIATAQSAMTDPDAVNTSSKEQEVDTDTSWLNANAKKESLAENLSDILKLAGTKSITSRDYTSGLTKVKEVTKLNESKQIDECGMGMPSNGSTPATLSINATASSGEEVANMLKSIMDLAGVKPVTADMLGGPVAPMPMVKAIDIVSAPDHDHDHDHDSMEPQEDELNQKPLTGSMEEEYANTPKDPTDVPKYDPEKMVFRPNQPGQGDRMDGTMPKGNPGLGEGLAQSLLKEYEAFKNGQ